MSDWADFRLEVFGLLGDSAGSEGWAEVAKRLAAAVPRTL